MDEDGYLYFVGRGDSIIKRRGYRIHPAEIEEAACGVPGVGQAQVHHGGEDGRLILFVTTSDPTLQGEDVLRDLGHELESFRLPDAVQIVPDLPVDGNGKVNRSGLSALAAGTAAQ